MWYLMWEEMLNQWSVKKPHSESLRAIKSASESAKSAKSVKSARGEIGYMGYFKLASRRLIIICY